MYWQRLEVSFGRNSLVGTTVNSSEILPKDLAADKKHTSINGEKTFISTRVGGECVLGAAMSSSAGVDDLTQSYGQFKTEALNVEPEYQPDSVNTDGWRATVNAWNALFPAVATILRFLHSFIKIRSCGKRLAGETVTCRCFDVATDVLASLFLRQHPHLHPLYLWSLRVTIV